MKQITLEALKKAPWFEPLIREVQEASRRITERKQTDRPALEKQVKSLEDDIRGWSLSLAKPDLPAAVRGQIEIKLNQAILQTQELECRLDELEAVEVETQRIITPELVLTRLQQLAEVLAQGNPTRGNLELSLHIDKITCFQDGRVVVRTCRLGVLAGAVPLMTSDSQGVSEPCPPMESERKARPRRRGRLRIDDVDRDSHALREALFTAADVDRFANLEPHWFWEEVFQLPKKIPWYKAHASEVAEKKKNTGWLPPQLAAHFGKSAPTIRLALKWAAVSESQPIEPTSSNEAFA